MNTTRAYWPIWIDVLRKQGLTDLVAWVLEAAGPLNFLGAQILYIGQPFVSFPTGQSMQALANLLEQEDEAGAFVAFLKGNSQ